MTDAIFDLIDKVDRQYEAYLKLADLTRIPTVMDLDESVAKGEPIAPMGFTLIKR